MDTPLAGSQKKAERLIFTVIILFTIVTAIYFRFNNLHQSPAWYSDEGNHIDLAENWMQGKWQNYGILGAPYSQRPPLYMYTVAAAMRLFGVDIQVSRGVSACGNLICCLLAGWIAWKRQGRREGILTLWVAAAAPWIVTFGRLGLTYNLMAPFFLFSLMAIHEYCLKPSPGWLAASAIEAALAFSTDYLGILCGVTAGLVLLVKRPRSLFGFGTIFLAVLVVVFLPVLCVNAGVFFTDMRNLFVWGGGVQSSSSSLISILVNYVELLRRESWILIGLCGLFLLKDGSLRNILLTAVGLTLLMVTRAYTPVGVGLHYLMHLFPIFALGLAVFMLHAYEFIKRLMQKELTSLFSRLPRVVSPAATLLSAAIVFTPLVWMVLSSFAITTYNSNYIFTGNDDLRLLEVKPAENVRAFISAHVSPGDLVLGSPAILWGLPTMNRADFLAALAYIGQKPQNYITVDRQRYTNDISLEKAKFVILDPLAEEFAPLVLPGMDGFLLEIHKMPAVFTSGNITVYAGQEK
ncbi:ArnT family glycosyltransferase [Leptolinea tardivitalis]|uniref:ArnT family glycosyltransferase n=1 Tax=Leptolinea tardivitalis TaxID=229920 RepID=UPI0007862AEC|nr:glycosyltransferase family 39 protein [Leptolinea tardivitalis]GAP21838.1 4-amino-4-deoxy-L-arabinose transferase [Leptolinea tardivitalis]